MKDVAEKPVVRLWEAIVTGIVLDLFLLFFAGCISPHFSVGLVLLYLAAGHWGCNVVIFIFRPIRQSRFGRDFVRFAFFVPVVLFFLVNIAWEIISV